MSYQALKLKAGIAYQLDIPGKLLLVDSIGVSAGIDIALVRNGTPGKTMPLRQKAFRHVGDFDGVVLTTAIDADVAIFISFDEVNLGLADGMSVAIPAGVRVTNTVGQEIPVLFAGTVAPVLGSVTVINAAGSEVLTKPYQAATVTDNAAVPVTAALTALLAASATRRGFRVLNTGANPVAIGGAGLTYANAAVILQPGETWNENEAAPALWKAICNTGLTSTLNLQTIV